MSRYVDPDDNRLFEKDSGRWTILSIKDGSLVRKSLLTAPSHIVPARFANDWSDEETAEWIAENSDRPELS